MFGKKEKSSDEMDIFVSEEGFKAAFDANRLLDESGVKLREYMVEHEKIQKNFIDTYSKYFYHVEKLEVLKQKCKEGDNPMRLAFHDSIEELIQSCKSKKELTHSDALLLQDILDVLGINGEEKKYDESIGMRFLKKVGWD